MAESQLASDSEVIHRSHSACLVQLKSSIDLETQVGFFQWKARLLHKQLFKSQGQVRGEAGGLLPCLCASCPHLGASSLLPSKPLPE